MNFDDYTVTENKPVKDNFTVYKLFKYPNPEEILRVDGYDNFKKEIDDNFEVLSGCGTFRDLLETATEYNYYIIKFVDEVSFLKAVSTYQDKIDDCEIRFKRDLFFEFNLNEEKAENLYEISLDYDFSYEGIYSFFEKIVNVIEDIEHNEN